MNGIKVNDLYNLEETIAADLLRSVEYPWEVLPKISEFILKIGNLLDEKKFEKKGENVWIAKRPK